MGDKNQTCLVGLRLIRLLTKTCIHWRALTCVKGEQGDEKKKTIMLAWGLKS